MIHPRPSCVLIDDEINCTEVLAYDIRRVRPDITVLKVFNDPRRAVEYLLSHTTDIVFLDIEMPGMNGFELLEQLTHLDASVVFCTAYHDYAIRAFRYMAVDYLLKPVDPEDLSVAISKALDRRHAPQRELIRQIQHTLESPNAVLNKIALPVELGYIMVDISTILYCEASSNYAKVHLADGVVHLLSRPLKYLDDLLHDQGFFRVHQSWLINTNHMVSFTRSDGGVLHMVNKALIPVSKSRKPAFEHFLTGLRL